MAALRAAYSVNSRSAALGTRQMQESPTRSAGPSQVLIADS
jgi:hypothetical protein